MVSSRTRTTTQRGLVKVRNARVVVMLLLIGVAVAIVLIDKKDTITHEENVTASVAEFPRSVTENPTVVIPKLPVTASEPVVPVSEIKIPEMPKSLVVENKIPEVVSNIKEMPSLAPKLNEINVAPLVDVTKTKKMVSEKSGDSKDKSVDSKKSVASAENVGKKKLSKQNNGLAKKEQIQVSKDFSGNFHIVQKGDSLSKISEKYYGTQKFWLALFNANRDSMKNDRELKLGQKLKLPSSEELNQMVAQSRRVSPKSQSHEHNFVATPSGKAKLALENTKQEDSKQNGRFYCIENGDTLENIAKKLGVSFLALYDYNKHIQNNPDRLVKGTKIWIPLASPNH